MSTVAREEHGGGRKSTVTASVEVVGDARMAVLEVGDPGGPPVVLLPGLSDGLAPVSRPAAHALVDAVPLPMQRFCGLVVSYRDPVRSQDTTRQLAADVAAVLARRLREPAWLLCHSMGAMVAQHLAADRPELVAGMVLSATLPRADDAFRRVLARWAAQVRGGRWHRFAADTLDASTTGGALLARRSRLVTPAELPDAALVRRHLALTGVAATHDARAGLGRIRCPVLVLAGDRDVVCPPHHAAALARAIPGAGLVVFHGLGHGFPEQAPDRYAEVVLDLLPDDDATRSGHDRRSQLVGLGRGVAGAGS